MAHEIDFSNKRANMAYVGETPWHSLGAKLPAGADMETWRQAAGLDWEVVETPVMFQDRTPPAFREFPTQKVLLRSDTRAPLSTVSKWYNTVQPGEVLGFFDELVKSAGFQLETAGSLRGGNRIWALARVGEDAKIIDGDMVRPYLLLATSYDASMATTAQFTSIRVVCNNTLTAAVGDSKRGVKEGAAEPKVKIAHLSKFDAQDVREQLTIAVSGWDEFIIKSRMMAQSPLDEELVDAFLLNLFKTKRDDLIAAEKARNTKGYKRVLELFNGAGAGSDMAGKTVWGAVNAVTQYVDHERGLKRETGLDAAWFGEGATLKDRAFSIAKELVLA
jgi:phage/plasmid-like protein (TIGR03299 family)